MTGGADGAGPILHMRGLRDGRLALSALLVHPRATEAPPLTAESVAVDGRTVFEHGEHRVTSYAFTLPAVATAAYRLGDDIYEVNAAFEGDLRVAYVSCNGQEYGDRDRPVAERDLLWRRLRTDHEAMPLQLLLHGGDQIYTDELVEVHPAVRRWIRREEMKRPPEGDSESGVENALYDVLFRRYVELYRHPDFAWLAARVPSLAMWDDHDICDGWGSLPEAMLDSPTGRSLFGVARKLFLLFQLGVDGETLPGIFRDPSGRSLTWHLSLPGLDVVAPDLRSERRPRQVMGDHGWSAFRAAMCEANAGQTLILSSVPALGPRLSWIEKVMSLTPSMEKYEDDLRDQWQSRAHRQEWRTFLRELIALHCRDGVHVAVLSGEIHVATRATLETEAGPLHQLVASGITHPPPPALYARVLGTLARLGEAPLPEHLIRLHPLPGRSSIYTAQRNYLMLARRNRRWVAWWELAEAGATPELVLD